MRPSVPPEARGRFQLETRVLCTPVKDATSDTPPSLSMMVLAGSMRRIVAIKATSSRADVAIFAADLRSDSRYKPKMFREWVLKALEYSGISQAEAARRLAAEFNISGGDRSLVNKIVKGKRELSARELYALAKMTGYAAPEIAPTAIPVRGFVRAASAFVEKNPDDRKVPWDSIEIPSDHSIEALIVEGDSQWPRFFDGEVILYNSDPIDPAALVDEYAVIETLDGQRLIKILRRNGSGWRLESHNAPPIDVDGITAAWRFVGTLWRPHHVHPAPEIAVETIETAESAKRGSRKKAGGSDR